MSERRKPHNGRDLDGNFRVKLDTVPGMRGHVYFIATHRSTETVPLDQAPADKPIWLDRSLNPAGKTMGNCFVIIRAEGGQWRRVEPAESGFVNC